MTKFQNLVSLYIISIIIAPKLAAVIKPRVHEGFLNNTSIIDKVLTRIQYQSFQYFWNGAEPTSAAARERYHSDGNYPQNDRNVVTSGGTGMGIMAIIAAIERKFVTRSDAVTHLTKMVGWLEKADRFHGAWPHWMYGETGKVKPFSEKDDGGDIIETAYLAEGLIAARQYFQNGNTDERNLAQRMDALWRGIEWNWYRNGGKNILYWHWSPKWQWAMNFAIDGWNECLIAYVLAAASPTYGCPPEIYHEGWARNGRMVNNDEPGAYGIRLGLKHNYAPNYGGPLFWAHYSFLGLDPRGLRDRYTDYFEHNKNHTLLNRAWCVDNPKHWKGYGVDSWGLTSSYSMIGYAGHKPGEDDLGVISPTAALSSIPYTPEESIRFALYMATHKSGTLWGEFGFYDAFSESANWTLPHYLAIDNGPIPVMIENYRSGLLWRLFMSAPEVQDGLRKLGFQSSYFKS